MKPQCNNCRFGKPTTHYVEALKIECNAMPHPCYKKVDSWCGQYQAKPAEITPVAPVEPEIVLKAGDVWAMSRGTGLRVVLIKNSDQLWEWGNNGCPSNWFYRYTDDAKTDADMIAFIKRNECIRIGHLSITLIKD